MYPEWHATLDARTYITRGLLVWQTDAGRPHAHYKASRIYSNVVSFINHHFFSAGRWSRLYMYSGLSTHCYDYGKMVMKEKNYSRLLSSIESSYSLTIYIYIYIYREREREREHNTLANTEVWNMTGMVNMLVVNNILTNKSYEKL